MLRLSVVFSVLCTCALTLTWRVSQGEARKLAIRTGHSFYGSLTVSESLSITASEAASIVANVTLVHRGHPFDVTLATSHA